MGPSAKGVSSPRSDICVLPCRGVLRGGAVTGRGKFLFAPTRCLRPVKITMFHRATSSPGSFASSSICRGPK